MSAKVVCRESVVLRRRGRFIDSHGGRKNANISREHGIGHTKAYKEAFFFVLDAASL